LKRWVLSRRDSVEKVAQIEASVGRSLGLPKGSQVDCQEPEGGVVFVRVEGLEFVEAGGRFIPFLGSQATMALFPSVTVDQGAIKFLLNGADVMRPGVRRFDDWGEAGKLVVVKEEGKGRAIAVGTSSVTSDEAKGMTKGSCVRSLHHVGDRFWSLHRAL
jgi:predicted RNA-binding protein (TIGR00451 family)